MELKETLDILTEFQHLYPTWALDIANKDQVNTWHKHFNKFNNKEYLKIAIENFIKNSKYNPTIAGIYEEYKEIEKFSSEEVDPY